MYKVHITKSIDEYRKTYENNDSVSQPGSVNDKIVESVSGRVMSIRKSGANLVFLVIEEAGIGL